MTSLGNRSLPWHDFGGGATVQPARVPGSPSFSIIITAHFPLSLHLLPQTPPLFPRGKKDFSRHLVSDELGENVFVVSILSPPTLLLHPYYLSPPTILSHLSFYVPLQFRDLAGKERREKVLWMTTQTIIMTFRLQCKS